MHDNRKSQTVDLLLFPEISLVTLGAVIDPLNIANVIAGETLYDIRLVTENGGPVTAANGLVLGPTHGVDAASPVPDLALVYSSVEVHPRIAPKVRNWLLRISRHGAKLGSLGVGAFTLAKLGLLDGYRCTLHWEHAELFREMYPKVDLSDGIYEFDRNRMTAAGGHAAMDMILQWIADEHGRPLAAAASEAYIHDTIRLPEMEQRQARNTWVGQRSKALSRAIQIMEANVEEPVTIPELARKVGVSERQLARLFKSHADNSPARYYLEVRLQRARQMVRHTVLTFAEIGTATGFATPSSFSKCYRDRFSRTPTEERKADLSAP